MDKTAIKKRMSELAQKMIENHYTLDISPSCNCTDGYSAELIIGHSGFELLYCVPRGNGQDTAEEITHDQAEAYIRVQAEHDLGCAKLRATAIEHLRSLAGQWLTESERTEK